MRVRQARPGDADAVRAFTADTWADRPVDDYLGDVFAEWVETDGARQRTSVAVVDGDPVGVVQTVRLSEYEAWQQGMRVHPDHRGSGVAVALTHAGFDWARTRGATVARNMVFGWNERGLGLSRAAGYDPGPAFRWALPEPDPGAVPSAADGTDGSATDEAGETATDEQSATVTRDPNAAWAFWLQSDARQALAGLGLHLEETWALAEITLAGLERARDEESLLVVDDGGTRATAHRVRVTERETGAASDAAAAEETETWAEYAGAAWADADAASTLFAAIARDAAGVGADSVRVLLPETTRAVSDAATSRVTVSEHADFVFRADLTRPLPNPR